MRFVNIACVAAVLCICAGCSTVRFNEREQLSRQDMQFDGSPLSADLENQVYQAREGASGVFSGSGGGGCGCY